MSTDSASSLRPSTDSGPLGSIPRLVARQAHLGALIARAADGLLLHRAFRWLTESLGDAFHAGPPEVFWRPAGRGHPGAIAQISWPDRGERLAFGLENTLAHAIVDRLLGYERFAGEERLQVTPVEWGILTFIAARSLAELGNPRGLILDRVGPESLKIDDLGPVCTLRWPIRIGPHAGSARLWASESTLEALLSTLLAGAQPRSDPQTLFRRYKSLAASWHAVAGSITCPDGVSPGVLKGIFPLDRTELSGGAADPSGPIELRSNDFVIPAEFLSSAGGPSLTVTGPLSRRSTFPENSVMTPSTDAAPTDVPVILTVELGKISIPLEELADLKPGMTLSLSRHAREPVELTSSGRLVARGELVQLDDVLGVRILNILL